MFCFRCSSSSFCFRAMSAPMAAHSAFSVSNCRLTSATSALIWSSSFWACATLACCSALLASCCSLAACSSARALSSSA
ncbi:Uncharacterised protein [Flavonifractor plautii]|uniref:Secreted protein n=1 Tax=Flavonifractor plautii TaxID=292800 RepID=A0A174HX63_FLAPL|nr:Uncharacterised protein [Flavonifractor plautii]